MAGSNALARATVHVAEDDESIRVAIERLLEAARFAAPGWREEALRCRPAAYLVQPFRGAGLLDAIRTIDIPETRSRRPPIPGLMIQAIPGAFRVNEGGKHEGGGRGRWLPELSVEKRVKGDDYWLKVGVAF